MMPSLSKQQTLQLVRYICVFTIALLSGLLVYDHGMAIPDDGNLMMAARRVRAGQVPFRDFIHFFYAPGSVYLLALLQEFFGESYLLMRLMWTVAQSFSVLLVFAIAARFVPKPLALLPAVVVLLAPGPWFKAFYPFCGLLAFWGMCLYLERPSRLRAGLMGTICAFVLFFRQDIGVWAVLLSFASIALHHIFLHPRRWRNFWMEESWLLGAATILCAPFLLYMAAEDALWPMVRGLYIDTPALTASNYVSLAETMVGLAQRDLVLFLIYGFHILVSVGGFFLLFAQKSRLDRLRLGLLAVFNLLSLLPAVMMLALIRVLQADAMTWIIFTLGLGQIYRWARAITINYPHTRHCKKVSLYSLFAVLLAVPPAIVYDIYKTQGSRSALPLYTGNIRSLLNQNRPFNLRGEEIYLSEPSSNHILSILNYVEENTNPQDAILFFPTFSLYNYLTERPNPTRFIGLWTGLYRNEPLKSQIETELISDLEKQDVRYIIVVNPRGDSISRLVQDYLDRHYLRKRAPLIVYEKRPGK